MRSILIFFFFRSTKQNDEFTSFRIRCLFSFVLMLLAKCVCLCSWTQWNSKSQWNIRPCFIHWVIHSNYAWNSVHDYDLFSRFIRSHCVFFLRHSSLVFSWMLSWMSFVFTWCYTDSQFTTFCFFRNVQAFNLHSFFRLSFYSFLSFHQRFLFFSGLN